MVKRQLVSDEVWEQNYRGPDDNSLKDTWARQAKACSAVEDPKIRDKVYEDFLWLLTDFKGIAGGRITANLGIKGREATTLFNCYVHNPADIDYPDPDSIDGIYDMLKAQAQTLKSEGGYGMNFSWIRPAGSYVEGIGGRTPGVLKFMELWDKSSEIITMGCEDIIGERKKGEKKKIRKGAQMGVLDCVSGDTLISTIQGKIKIKDLVDKTPLVYCTDNDNIFIRKANKVWSKGVKKVVKITFDNDETLVCTPDHRIMMRNGNYKQASNLQFGDSVCAFHKRLYNKYLQLSATGTKTIPEHIAVAEYKYNRYPITVMADKQTFDESSEVVHHADLNPLNNSPENLELVTRAEHSSIHYEDACKTLDAHRDRIADERRGKTLAEYYGEKQSKAITKKRLATRKKNNTKPWNFGLTGEKYTEHYKGGFSNQFGDKNNGNHKVISVEEIGEEEVFDISVPEFHNCVANDIFIHNCWHPDIENFIEAKLVSGVLTKFNLSVGITEGFMDAVINDLDWDLVYPITDVPEFKKHWKGDIEDWKSRSLPITVYRTVKAREIWDKIMQSTYTKNDPGVLFLDTINNKNPLKYAEKIHTTNPCFHGDERFLTENGYVKFNQSADSSELNNIIVDNRVSYNDSGEEKPENWKIDVNKSGSIIKEASPAFITKDCAELLELEFSNGQLLRCTPDHHIATDSGMVEAQYLTPEHQILVAKVDPPTSKVFDQEPQTTSEISAFLMGLIAGDGCFSRTAAHLEFWGPDKDRMKKLCCKLIDTLYGSNTVKHSKNWENRTLSNYYISEFEDRVRITSTWVGLFLTQNYGFSKGTKKIVPEMIFNQARTSVGQFYLAGLYYADGTLSKIVSKGISVRLPQSDKSFLRQIQMLCHANGIITSIYFRRPAGVAYIRNKPFNRSEQYELITTHGGWKLFDRIGFGGHPEKDNTLLSLLHGAKKYYDKKSYTNLTSVKDIESDVVYCLKEDDRRSVIVNTISARRCGEINMSTGVCLLFSLNLVKYVKKHDGDYKFDFDTFEKAVKVAVRFADNINDISRTPLAEYSKSMQDKRRLGIGVLGLGSLHYVLGIRFGSEKSLQLIEDIFKTKAETEILTSAELGKEKGSFKLFDKDQYFSSHWWKTVPISKKVKNKVEAIGQMRNSHRAANAPTGNMSVYAGVVSGGIEPVIWKEYIRWMVVPEYQRSQLKKDGFKFPNISKGEWFETEHMTFAKAGEEEILLGSFGENEYQIDKNRGLTKKTLVEDWGWSFVKEHLSKEQLTQYENDGVFATTNDLTIHEHLNTLKIIAPFVDQNSSKTINLPQDFNYEDFKHVYLEAWTSGIKGITTYRHGTMTAVLEDSNKEEKEEKAPEREAPARPHSLKSETIKVKLDTGDGIKNAYVTVSFFPDTRDPYEVFINTPVGNNLKDLQILELSARMTSLALRHGISVEFINDQLAKIDGQYIYSIPNSLSKALQLYTKTEDVAIEDHSETDDTPKKGSKCPQCGAYAYVQKESCGGCLECGYEKCG